LFGNIVFIWLRPLFMYIVLSIVVIVLPIVCLLFFCIVLYLLFIILFHIIVCIVLVVQYCFIYCCYCFNVLFSFYCLYYCFEYCYILLYIVILFVLLYIVNNSCYNILTYYFGSYNIVQLIKINTSPCRPAPMGPNFQTHVYEPLLELHGDLWAQGATFGRDRPLRRQLLLLYHPCLAYRSQPSGCSDGPENGRSARRPT
jgi:hypothetical protein